MRLDLASAIGAIAIALVAVAPCAASPMPLDVTDGEKSSWAIPLTARSFSIAVWFVIRSSLA